MKQLNLEDLSSPGAELMAVIRQYLRNYVSTAFLAEVTATYTEGNTARVDVKEINIFKNDDNQPLERREILNLSVGVIGGKAWTVSYPIAIGDIGLCIVSKYDLTDFLDKGTAGNTRLSRVFDPADSIYIPLALYLQPEITADLEIKSKDEKTIINITPEGNITINNEGNVVLNNKGNVTANVEGKTTVKCNTVEIGNISALEKTIRGETFMQFFNNHVHLGNLGAPTSEPQIPMTEAQLSKEVKNS